MFQGIEVIFLPLFLIGAPILLLMAPSLIAAFFALIRMCARAAWIRLAGG